jgi:RecA-family ATPase
VLPWSISAKDFMQRTFPEPWWIIDNLLPGHQVCIIRGPGGVMKSWFAMLGAVCVEHGRDFLGHYVPEPRRVLYVQEEMAEVYFQERLDLIYRSLGLEATDDLRFVSGQSFKIDNENAERGWPRLMQEVEDFKPTLVILDPLVEMHDGEENTVEDMRPVMMKLRTARFSHPLSFWVLHHNNRLDQMRGSTSIRDAADLVIELKPTDALRKSQVHFDKARNLRDPQDFIFEIQLHGDEIEFVRIDTGKARVVPYTETTIIEMIDERGPMNLGQLADALGVPLNQRLRDTVNVMAGQKHILEEVGRARQGGKVYGLR